MENTEPKAGTETVIEQPADTSAEDLGAADEVAEGTVDMVLPPEEEPVDEEKTPAKVWSAVDGEDHAAIAELLDEAPKAEAAELKPTTFLASGRSVKAMIDLANALDGGLEEEETVTREEIAEISAEVEAKVNEEFAAKVRSVNTNDVPIMPTIVKEETDKDGNRTTVVIGPEMFAISKAKLEDAVQKEVESIADKIMQMPYLQKNQFFLALYRRFLAEGEKLSNEGKSRLGVDMTRAANVIRWASFDMRSSYDYLDLNKYNPETPEPEPMKATAPLPAAEVPNAQQSPNVQ